MLSCDRRKLIKLLPFGKSVFSQLAKIGKARAFKYDHILAAVPANYSTLYKIAKMTEPQIAAAVEQKVINPKMRREDLTKWLNVNYPTTKSRASAVFATILLRASLEAEQFEELRKELDAMADKYYLRVRLRDGDENPALPPGDERSSVATNGQQQ